MVPAISDNVGAANVVASTNGDVVDNAAMSILSVQYLVCAR